MAAAFTAQCASPAINRSPIALLLGAIATGTTTIEGLLPAEDLPEHRRPACGPWGSRSQRRQQRCRQRRGRGLDGLQEPARCSIGGNSGTTMRLMLGSLAATGVISCSMEMAPCGGAPWRGLPNLRLRWELRSTGAMAGTKRPWRFRAKPSAAAMFAHLWPAPRSKAAAAGGINRQWQHHRDRTSALTRPQRTHAARLGADLLSQPQAAEGPTVIVKPGSAASRTTRGGARRHQLRRVLVDRRAGGARRRTHD